MWASCHALNVSNAFFFVFAIHLTCKLLKLLFQITYVQYIHHRCGLTYAH